MSERVLYLVLLGSYAFFAGLYVFWINPAKQERIRAYQEAVKVARFFGDKDFELVRFKTDGGGIFVFIEKRNEAHYYPLSYWFTEQKNSFKKAERYVKMVCSVFPSHIPQSLDGRNYDRFKRDVREGIDDYDL